MRSSISAQSCASVRRRRVDGDDRVAGVVLAAEHALESQLEAATSTSPRRRCRALRRRLGPRLAASSSSTSASSSSPSCRLQSSSADVELRALAQHRLGLLVVVPEVGAGRLRSSSCARASVPGRQRCPRERLEPALSRGARSLRGPVSMLGVHSHQFFPPMRLYADEVATEGNESVTRWSWRGKSRERRSRRARRTRPLGRSSVSWRYRRAGQDAVRGQRRHLALAVCSPDRLLASGMLQLAGSRPRAHARRGPEHELVASLNLPRLVTRVRPHLTSLIAWTGDRGYAPPPWR